VYSSLEYISTMVAGVYMFERQEFSQRSHLRTEKSPKR